MTEKIKLYMGIPSTGSRSDAQMYILRALEKKYSDRIEFVYPTHFVGRIFHDYARNAYVEDFLASDCEAIWFLDSDIIPPDNILDVFDKYAEWDLAGAPYPVFMKQAHGTPTQIVMCVYEKNSEGKLVRCDCPTEGERYIDGVATGCLFIKRGVFSKLEAPYFEFKYDPKSRAISEGEDLGFCKKVSELGYKFYVNFALACDHEKKVSLLAVSNYAMTFASDAINAYDKQFRSSLTRFKMQQQMAKQEEAKSKLILPERFK